MEAARVECDGVGLLGEELSIHQGGMGEGGEGTWGAWGKGSVKGEGGGIGG